MTERALTSAGPGRGVLRRLTFLLPVVVFVAVAIALGIGLTRNPQDLPSALIGKPVPAFSLPPVQGRTLGLPSSDLKGEVSLVNVFASCARPAATSTRCRKAPPMIVARDLFPAALFAALVLALPDLGTATRPAAAESPARFALHDSPEPVPEIRFENREGETLSLADFHGQVVLLNVWATWCAPCRREMPTLDRLQAGLGGANFQVVALSIDRQGLPAVEAFYREIGLETLPIYVDPSGASQRALRVLGIPTTLLLDRDGREIGRLAGPAEWDSPEMVAFIRSYVERQSGGGADLQQLARLRNRPAAAGRQALIRRALSLQ